jgi:hypothetical protein
MIWINSATMQRHCGSLFEGVSHRQHSGVAQFKLSMLLSSVGVKLSVFTVGVQKEVAKIVHCGLSRLHVGLVNAYVRRLATRSEWRI